jgi:hypothetical protein
MYRIPDEHFCRIHHIRPRFKNDVENVLLYMATEIAKMEKAEQDIFKERLNSVIRLYPGNASKDKKTINNWRTEISSLFGLIEYDGDYAMPGRMAALLADNQDLIEFFRYFLYHFQYPGGHLKPHETAEYIKSGIKFKPAKYLIQVMLEGKRLSGESSFGVTKAEATHCIFNDLRATRDGRSPRDTALLIMNNRKFEVEYDHGGDVTRYAGDILDYMELADLVRLRPNYQYYLNASHLETIQGFVDNDTYFQPYERYYDGGKFDVSNIAQTQEQWFAYVNERLDSAIFEADALSIIEEVGEKAETEDKSVFITEILEKIRNQREAEVTIRTKEIGDIGEAIVIEHEKVRLTNAGKKELIRNIHKIPELLAAGYDISSFEGVGELRRLIEVKTTISRGKLSANNFHMSPSEWSAASSYQNVYFVYRLMVSSEDITLFLIQDPVGKYKKDLLEMVPRNGADIRYGEKSGNRERLLV